MLMVVITFSHCPITTSKGKFNNINEMSKCHMSSVITV